MERCTLETFEATLNNPDHPLYNISMKQKTSVLEDSSPSLCCKTETENHSHPQVSQ